MGYSASPILYSLRDLPSWLQPVAAANPVAGITELYRAALFGPSTLSSPFSFVACAWSALLTGCLLAWALSSLHRPSWDVTDAV